MSTHQAETQQDRIASLQPLAEAIHEHVQSALHEFQTAVVSARGDRVEAVDTLVVGSFIDPTTDSPGDFDILVVTKSGPPEEIQDAFWRYINDQDLSLTDPFYHPVSDVKVDCVGVASIDQIGRCTHGNRAYSLRDAEFVETSHE